MWVYTKTTLYKSSNMRYIKSVITNSNCKGSANMITENISNLLSKINWDYNYSEKELLSLINKKNDFSNQRLSLYIKSLETFTWQELVSLWGLEECNNLYTDKVRKGLFSNKIREQYDGIFNLLRNKTLSYTKRSPEDLEKFKSTLLFNRRNRTKQRVF